MIIINDAIYSAVHAVHNVVLCELNPQVLRVLVTLWGKKKKKKRKEKKSLFEFPSWLSRNESDQYP